MARLTFYCERHGLTMVVDGNRRTLTARPRSIGAQTCALATAEIPQAGKLYLRRSERYCPVVEIGGAVITASEEPTEEPAQEN